MSNCFFGNLTVSADGRVSAPDTMQVSCCQRRMASAYLCHSDALVPGPISLPMLVTVLSACKYPMDSGMWIAEVPILSDTPLVHLRASMDEVRSIRVDDCESVLPHLTSWSAAELPSRPMCASIHWTLTSFKYYHTRLCYTDIIMMSSKILSIITVFETQVF